MASLIYNRFFMNLALGDYHLDADDIRVALIDNTYTPNKNHTDWDTGTDPYDSEVAAGNGYTAGGGQLANATVSQDDTNDLAKWDADNFTWQTSTITAKHATLWNSTHANNDLICDFEFTEDKSSANGDFTLQWNASGIITLQQS